jgi:hypothetical protein
VAIKILDKEKIKQEDLGESIKKEISFEIQYMSTTLTRKGGGGGIIHNFSHNIP